MPGTMGYHEALVNRESTSSPEMVSELTWSGLHYSQATESTAST